MRLFRHSSRPVNMGRPAGGFPLLWLVVVLQLAACTPSPEEPGSSVPEGWHSLFDGSGLSGWEVTNFGGEGKIVARQGQIVLDRGEDLTGITWTREFPDNDYEITLEAMRLQGNDFFCSLTFPIRESHASLIVAGWAGSVVGLSSINGRDASENETTRRMKFENHRWYRILLRVTGQRVRAWIDGERVVDVPVADRRFEVRPEVRLSRPLGIAAWRSRAALRDLRWRPVSAD